MLFLAAYPIVSANAWSQGKSKKTSRLGTLGPKSSLCVALVCHRAQRSQSYLLGILFLPRTRSSRQMPGLKANPKRRHAWGRLDPSDPSVVLCLCGHIPLRPSFATEAQRSQSYSLGNSFLPRTRSSRQMPGLRQIQKDVTPGDVQTQVIPLCSLCLCGHIPLRPSFATEAEGSQSYSFGILFLPRTRSSRQMPGLKANPKRRHAWGRLDPSHPSVVLCVSVATFLCGPRLPQRHRDHRAICWEYFSLQPLPIVSANAWSQGKSKKTSRLGIIQTQVIPLCRLCVSVATFLCGPRLPQRPHEESQSYLFGNIFLPAYPIVSANAWSSRQIQKDVTPGDVRPKSSLCVLVSLWPHSSAALVCHRGTQRNHRAICLGILSCRVPDSLGKCLASRQIQKDVTPGDVRPKYPSVFSVSLWLHSSAALGGSVATALRAYQVKLPDGGGHAAQQLGAS